MFRRQLTQKKISNLSKIIRFHQSKYKKFFIPFTLRGFTRKTFMLLSFNSRFYFESEWGD